MGWSGTRKLYATNLENIKHLVLGDKTENEWQTYEKVTQKGSHVFILIKDKKTGKHFIDCELCQTTRSHGYVEFQWKGLNAIREMMFDVPKTWLVNLDLNDEVNRKYITAREEYEAKKKLEHKIVLNDMFSCTSDYPLNWTTYKIGKDTQFYIRYVKCGKHKYFMLCDEKGELINEGSVFGYRLSRPQFNHMNKQFVRNIA